MYYFYFGELQMINIGKFLIGGQNVIEHVYCESNGRLYM